MTRTRLTICFVLFGLWIAMWVCFNAAQEDVDAEGLDVEAPDEWRPAADAPPSTPEEHPAGTTIAAKGDDGGGSYRIIPPRQGKWEEMWGGLRDIDDMFLPVFGLESLNDALKKKGYGNVKVSDFKPEHLFIEQTTPQGTLQFIAAFTDHRLLNDGVLFQTIRPIDLLRDALADEKIDGVYFNPRCRVCDRDWGAYGINRFGVAELIGYLEGAPDRSGRPYHELALQAEREGKPHQVLYYWGMSFREGRPGDDWRRAELAKIRAYHALDFPGAKDRAVGEVEWFIKNHGGSAEANGLLRELRAGRGSASR
ncbi:MAG: hypothetical protein JXP34_11215 [Planctomycetes bacterium]|nr:hypothetical protein [Planctomycetota bacterium]